MVIDLTHDGANNPSDLDVDTKDHEPVMIRSQKVYTSKVGDNDQNEAEIAEKDSKGIENEANSGEMNAEYEFYKGDPSLPVFQSGLLKGLGTDEIATILIKGSVTNSRVATRVPTDIDTNVAFIVDTSKILDKEDMKCDDLGAWLCTGSKKMKYLMVPSGKVTKVEKREVSDEQCSEYIIQRQFFTNKSMPSLRKTIVTAREEESTIMKDLVFIQYIFGEGEQEVNVQLHGNAKSSRCGPFKRTMKSTINLIKDQIETLPARETVHKVIKDRGGIMKVESSGEVPRNRNQVYNIAKEVKKQTTSTSICNDDPMLQVLVKAKEEQQSRSEDIFIREIPLFPEPIIFLATQQ